MYHVSAQDVDERMINIHTVLLLLLEGSGYSASSGTILIGEPKVSSCYTCTVR